MYELKLTQIGTSTGTIIPKEMLAELNLEKGDKLFAVKSPDGFMLTPYDAEFAKQMKIGRKIMKERRDVLRELAK